MYSQIFVKNASLVEWLESPPSNSVTSLAWVRSPGDALVVGRDERSLVLLLSMRDG